jgi:hypothetical protein
VRSKDAVNEMGIRLGLMPPCPTGAVFTAFEERLAATRETERLAAENTLRWGALVSESGRKAKRLRAQVERLKIKVKGLRKRLRSRRKRANAKKSHAVALRAVS